MYQERDAEVGTGRQDSQKKTKEDGSGFHGNDSRK